MIEERRRRARFALNVPLHLRLPGSSYRDARLLDVSLGGCRLQSLTPIRFGETVFLRLPGLAILRGEAAWAHDLFAGIEFDEPMAPAVLDHLLGEVAPIGDRETRELRGIAERCDFLAARADQYGNARHLRDLAGSCRTQAAIASLVLAFHRSESASPP